MFLFLSKVCITKTHILLHYTRAKMNYKPSQNPTFVNECILEYIDNVMYDECETKQDIWTIDKIVSCEKFGSTICKKCSENKDKLASLVRGFKTNYDEYMTETTDSVPLSRTKFMPKLNRETTPYKEVYYKVRSKIFNFGMNDLFLNCSAKENCVNNEGNYWTPCIIFNLGEMLFKSKFEPICEHCKSNWKLVSLKIDNLVLESNMELLERRLYHELHLNKVIPSSKW